MWQSDDGMTINVGNERRMVETVAAPEQVVPEDFVSMRPSIVGSEVEQLDENELAGLLFMREEEKLARDVYTTLYDRWGINIFSNIAQSEQTHTESVRQLLEKYGIPDPVEDDAVGVFTNPNLQKLYDDLLERGNVSEVEALKVGALIEDLDIKDLADQLELTDNADIQMVYENLQRGSRNHLRSFTKQLEMRGESYEPQYISVEEYESILESNTERGGNGGGQRGWGGNGGGMRGNR